MLAWQNRPQKLVAKFIKQTLLNEKANIDNDSFRETLSRSRRSTGEGRLRSTSESSVGEVYSYEDENSASKKFTGKDDGTRVRIDSMSQITGVRFDDPN